MFFGGDTSPMTVAAATDIVDTDVVIVRGRTYQLGTDDVTPMGTKKITNLVVSKIVPGALPADPPTVTAVTLAGNFEVDLERARVYVEADAKDVANGDTLRFKYDQEGYSREIIIAKGQQVSGALRFIADNPHGANRDYFMPYVKVTSNGDYSLKGDDWMKMSFNYEVLKKDAVTERQYIDSVGA
jgi:YD repeat-containing protein